ncbi:MAG TPA: hypothetical protein VKQ54_08995 [Caulobacteraceae bacterium]|nr:hypothetical protein [Caulobacteraceae bacterium]
MSDHEVFPAFAGSGDPREEALWAAYQAMLRRRKDARAAPLAGAVGGPGPDRRATAGVGLTLAAGAALALGLWALGSADRTGGAPAHGLRVIAETHPKDVLMSHPALPCFVGGQPVGRFTLDDCASRNGVASGPLDVGLGAQAASPATVPVAPPRGAVAQVPLAPSPPAFQPPMAMVPPPARLDDPATPIAQRPPPRLASPPAPVFADAAPTPRLLPPLRILARFSVPRPPLPQPPPLAAQPRQMASFEPPAREAPIAGVARRSVAQISPRRASTLAVREFYRALGEGDGARAAAVVVPERRDEGSLSAGELTRFSSSLRAPIRVTRIEPVNDETVFVSYQFVTADNRLCTGTARVNTSHRDGDTLVQGIRAFNGC